MTLGRTITELQASMPMGEFHTWLAYRRKYGPMNPVRLYDSGPALIASMVNNAHGGKAKPKDFMPFGKSDEPPNIEEFVAAFGAGVKRGR